MNSAMQFLQIQAHPAFVDKVLAENTRSNAIRIYVSVTRGHIRQTRREYHMSSWASWGTPGLNFMASAPKSPIVAG